MVAHLVWHDVKQNLRPIRALPLLVIAVLLAYRAVESHYGLGDRQDFLYFAEGAFSRNDQWLFFVVPLFAGSMGGSLAADRRAGVTMSILGRGVPRSRYLLAKLLGAAVSSGLMTFAAILGFFAIVFTTWIPGRAHDVDPNWLVGPVESLFVYSPFAHDLLVALMHITAATGLSVVGVLAGLIVANEYVAMVATPLFVILVRVIVGYSGLLNPVAYLEMNYYSYFGPHFRWLIPCAPFLYWSMFALIISFLCQRIFAKKEIA